MCGIVGYVGIKNNAVDFVLKGLRTLEYRGYDSAGISYASKDAITICKQVGNVNNLQTKLAKQQPNNTNSKTAIGHTRWATHGKPTVINAHPHANANNAIVVAHNGIIENHEELRTMLAKNDYHFTSDTDTEVIPHLIDFYLRSNESFQSAFEQTIKDLVGAYAIVALHAEDPSVIYAAKLSSPLVIGVGTKEHIIASDPTAISKHADSLLHLEDYEVAVISAQSIQLHDIQKSTQVHRQAQLHDLRHEQQVLGDFKHFMLKEINEIPSTIVNTIRGHINDQHDHIKLGGLEQVASQLQHIERIIVVACGTSYYAGMVGEYLIEDLAGIPVEVQLASEFKYRNEPLSRSTAILAISQSGETADTIAALKKIENSGLLRLGIVNVVGSTIARMTDAGVYCHAGVEQSVASTKAFVAQVSVLAQIASYFAQLKGVSSHSLLSELSSLPNKVTNLLEDTSNIQRIAKKYASSSSMLFIGRNYLFPCALEGALKLKEVSYIHAEGYAAGELKHGPLALIDERTPTIALVSGGKLRQKTLSSMQEIRARGGPIIAISTQGDKQAATTANDTVYVPKTTPQLQPILMVVVLQLLAYYVAVAKKLNVDRPRNLAKSVTVE